MSHSPVVPLFAHLLQPGTLPLISLRVHLQKRDRQRLISHKLVHTNDDAPPLINLALIAVRSVGDLLLKEASLNSRDDPAQRINPLKVVIGLTLDPVGERFDGIGPTQWIDRIGDARLVGDDLLGA